MEWLERGSNREEWERLAGALELADGFQFFCAQTGDRIADQYLGEFLRELASREHLGFAERTLGADAAVADVLSWLRSVEAPALFWIHRAADDAELGEFFSLLNQKRDVVAKLASSPLVLGLHALDWNLFRRHAPDFWSIHQIVCRFTPGREAASRPFRRLAREPSPARTRASGWRLASEALKHLNGRKLFGRDSEISFLISALARPGTKILIYGLTGIGKTVLVRHVVQKLVPYYPDGVWWVAFDLCHGDPETRAREILGRLLDELLPSTEPHRDPVRRFRAVTASMRALFVFEDVDGASVVESLAPGGTSSVIFTSRYKLDSDMFDHMLALGAIGADAGADLLHTHAHLDIEAARTLAVKAAGNPSLLNLAAALLTDNPDASSEITALLSGQSSDRATIDAAVSRGLERRSREARVLWPQLSLFRADFGPGDASAISEYELDRCSVLLRELGEIGMIEPTSTPHGYRFFDLLREPAERLLDSREDADDSRLAYASWILSEKGPASVSEDVQAATKWLRERYDLDDALHDSIEDIAEAAVAAWADSQAAGPVMALALEIAQRAGHHALLAQVYAWFAREALLHDELATAEHWYSQQLALARTLRDPAVQSGALVGLGDVARSRGVVAEALQRYESALAGALTSSARLGLYRRLGHTAAEAGDSVAAMAYLHNALAEAGDNPSERASVHRALAFEAFRQSALVESEALVRTAIAEGGADLPGLAQSYALLGSISEERGDYHASTAAYEAALAIYERIGDRTNAAHVKHELGNIAAASGDFERAEAWYRTALEIASSLDDEYEIMENFIQKGDLQIRKGNDRLAQHAYEYALTLAAKVGDEPALAYVLVQLARLAKERGEYERAVAYSIRAAQEPAVEMRPEYPIIEEIVHDCYVAAPPPVRTKIRRMWEAAGLEWSDIDKSDE